MRETECVSVGVRVCVRVRVHVCVIFDDTNMLALVSDNDDEV